MRFLVEKNKNIVVIGAGALGSHLLLFIRNLDCNITVIDFDKVEQKNVRAQFHTKMGIRKNKAQALQQSLNGLFNKKIKIISHKLTSNNSKQLLSEADLVVDCTDNAQARRDIQKTVRDMNIECVHGALDANGTFGRIIWDEHFQEDEEGNPGQATCENSNSLPFFAFVSAKLANEVQEFILNGKKRSFNLTESSIVRIA